jgi:hypothetical protein
MTLRIYENLEQGSDEWLQARCGILTASTVGQLITAKTVKVAANDYSRALTAQLVAERITGHVEPTFESYDMEQGHINEPIARDLYTEHYAYAYEVGFMTNVFNGYTLGYSPDGLVGDSGLIEIKSRQQKKHLQTILAGTVPLENMAQIQTGLLVTGRGWLDYISYCGGMPLWVHRVYPDPAWQEAIVAALTSFEQSAGQMIEAYQKADKGPMTERVEPFPEIEF